jgi:phage tail protein X
VTRDLVFLAALAILALCWRKYGLKSSLSVACMIALAIPGLSLAGMILPSICRALGITAPSLTAQFVGGASLIAGVAILARRVGWGKVLGGIFTLAMGVCVIVILGFLFVTIVRGAN